MWHGPLEERQDELQRAGEAEEEVETGPQARRLRMCPEPEVPSHGVLTVRRGAWYGRLVARNGFLTTGVALLAAGVAAAPGLAGAAPLDVPVVPASVYGTYSKVAGVTATAGWTAWSVGSGATWRLMLRTPSGAITTPPIPARRIPFDASLGVGRGGVVDLAYSRCTRDPSHAPGGVAIAWYTARGCVLHLRAVATGAERVLRLTTGSRADFLPAVSGARIAYAALARSGGRASIVVRTLPNGTVGKLYTGPADHFAHELVDVARGPAAVALDSAGVAFEWDTVDNAPGRYGLPAFGVDLYAARSGRAVRLDARGGATDGACGGYTDLASLSTAGGHALAEVTSPVGWELERVALDQPAAVALGRRPAAIRYANGAYYGPDPQVDYLPAVAVDGGRVVFTSPASAGALLGDSPLDPFMAGDRLVNPYEC